jgi:TonB family protein
MPPVSLLFSSDEETSRRLVQALGELDLEVAPYPDIFTAIEWLTSRSFDLIVADWDSGPEAAFLLKNARELKLNEAAFTVAVTSEASKLAAEADDPDLVLTKPLIPDQIKYALLSNDRFLGCMKAWIARGDFAQAQAQARAAHATSDVVNSEEQQTRSKQPSLMPLSACPAEPSPTLYNTFPESSAPLNLTFATLDRRLFRSMNERGRGEPIPSRSKRRIRNKFRWGTALCVVFVSVGCIFGQPVRVQSVLANAATAYEQARKTIFSRQQSSENAAASDSAALTQSATPQIPRSGRYPSLRPRAIPPHATFQSEEIATPPAETLQADAPLDQDRLSAAVSRVQIPESLRMPPEATAVRTVSARRSSSLLSQVEPVNLPEDLSRGLVLDRVQPSYPEQALKAGLQGAVVLQAWIGKDGSIRDLKLINGSLLLGQAAVRAVKQWRYKPYLQNGVAVEAETYVTVNFRLP